MTIQLDGTVVTTTMRTPGNDYELAVGSASPRAARRCAGHRRALLRRRLRGRKRVQRGDRRDRRQAPRPRRASARRRRAAGGAAATRSTTSSPGCARCRRSTPIDDDVLAACPLRARRPGAVRRDRRRPRRRGVRPRRSILSRARTSVGTTPSTRWSAPCCWRAGCRRPAAACSSAAGPRWRWSRRRGRRGFGALVCRQRPDRAGRRRRAPAGITPRRLRPRGRLQRLTAPLGLRPAGGLGFRSGVRLEGSHRRFARPAAGVADVEPAELAVEGRALVEAHRCRRRP